MLKVFYKFDSLIPILTFSYLLQNGKTNNTELKIYCPDTIIHLFLNFFYNVISWRIIYKYLTKHYYIHTKKLKQNIQQILSERTWDLA